MMGSSGHRSTSREGVAKLITEWLNKGTKTSVNFEEASDADIRELNNIIDELIRFRFSADADGDRPINWQLCNRSTHVPHLYTCTTHLYDASLEDLDRAMDLALLNVSLATSELQSVIDFYRFLKK